MKIKTVYEQSAAEFDKEVNAALADGWKLTRRMSDQPAAFIAELELEETQPAPDPVELVRELQALCDCVALEICQCGGCPLDWLCRQIGAGRQLDEWELPEEG